MKSLNEILASFTQTKKDLEVFMDGKATANAELVETNKNLSMQISDNQTTMKDNDLEVRKAKRVMKQVEKFVI